MKLKYGMMLLSITLVASLPVTVSADSDKSEWGQGNYKDNKGKGHGKDKFKEKYEYESEYKDSAGGPPPWAPAHGWRKKHGKSENDRHEVVRYAQPTVVVHEGTKVVMTGSNATVDVGVEQGNCNRKAIGTVLGGVVGGVIGNRVGGTENREMATVLGVVLGGVVGHEIGRSMDKADQHCTGQVLEQAYDNQTVRWADHNNVGQYSVTPLRTYQADGVACRDFVTEYHSAGVIKRERSTACRNSEGAWSKRVM